MTRLGFIGVGNMAGAIIAGILGAGLMSNKDIGVFDIDREKLEDYRIAGHKTYSDIPAIVADCSFIVLSVKPQSFDTVLPEVKKSMTPEKVIVSIAAGITANSIRQVIGFECKIILVMPNTPLLLGAGATALARVEPTTAEEFDEIRRIFASGGISEEISPNKMCEVIPVNGSSPAFIYEFARIVADSAQRHGIDRNTALRLFSQTLIGSAQMLTQSGKSPEELIEMVCSPGGTTLAAMRALEDNGFAQAVTNAFNACVERAKELSSL